MHIDDRAPWRTEWFNGASLMLQPHAVAVITPAASTLPTLPLIATGAAAYAGTARVPSCAACHGVAGDGGPAPAIRGVDRVTVAASHAASASDAGSIAPFLAGLIDATHAFAGEVLDDNGMPIEDAMVLADFGAHGQVAFTDANGRFHLSAARGDEGPFAVVPQLFAIHPDFHAAGHPKARMATSLSQTDVVFELTPNAVEDGRPLLARAHVVPHTGPDVPEGAWTVGVASAGDELQVWAVHRASGQAVRLHEMDGHPYGLFHTRVGVMNPPANERHWAFIAVAADGATSSFKDLRP